MRKLHLFVITILLSIQSIAQSSQKIAQMQFDSGDYLQSLQSYLSLKEGKTYSLNNTLQIARCYSALGLEVKANKWYGDAISKTANNLQYNLEIGRSMMLTEQYELARELFSGYKLVDPKTANHFLGMLDNLEHINNNQDNYSSSNALHSNSISNEFAAILYNGELLRSGDHKLAQLKDNTLSRINSPGCSIMIDALDNSLLKENQIVGNMAPFYINEANDIAYVNYTSKCQSFKARRDNNSIYIGSIKDRKILNEEPFSYNKVGVSNTDPFLTKEGSVLYFSSDMPGGFGGFDLYYSIKDNDSWSAPVNLGEEINTPGDDITPFIDEENNLYFASDYHYGLGGFDIFKAEYVLGNWINVTNLGGNVNSSGNDYYPYIDEIQNRIYYTSNRNESLGGEDIFFSHVHDIQFELSESETPMALIVSDQENALDEDGFNEFEMPKAQYIGDYQQPRRSNVTLVSLPQHRDNIIPVKWNFNMKRSGVNEFVHVPNNDVVDVTPPPAFKLPTSKKSDNVDLVSFEGARLVAVGEVIEKPIESVYFIQLAAFYSTKGQMKTYQSLSSLGNIYKVSAGAAVKVRLGHFANHSEASNVLQRVRNLGFDDAFLVNTDLDPRNMELIYSNFDENTTTTINDNNNVIEESEDAETSSNNFEYSKPISNESIEYKVRLASYEDPIWFESSKIKDLGQLEQWSKGAWTIFILSGFDSYESADQARIKAVNRGYADAEVVIDNQGIIERLKKN